MDWLAIVSLVLFLFTAFCVVRPITIDVTGCFWRLMGHDGTSVRVVLTLDFATVPFATILILRFIGALSLQQVLDGILRVGHVQPWKVLIIFFALAYASISADVTGLSKFV